ncbi:CKLF-like MARVEL transmembrane domain-containing protein 7 isoform X2 [Denticeps clupeoides]|uniref:MARVEL domain-containing protein n=1 Tax=Denticeps clupeoides TaxID=299321 RepID=A0AAY4D037_9TELE|nr:CKLF-like MARVEL transmembrane domain-containing protein 7 [Denticeps clupeoides]XP_028847998.1 CKLF-like MARVEL transmembrane domain-containing protein 7 isoform X2 [Denticeps clupeoides]
MASVVNVKYLRSARGLLKVAQLVVLLPVFLCVHTSWHRVSYAFAFFHVTTLVLLVAILLFLILAALKLPSRVTWVNWDVTEFALDILGFFSLVAVSCTAAVKSCDVPLLMGASISGILLTYLLAASASLSFQAAWRPPSTQTPGQVQDVKT